MTREMRALVLVMLIVAAPCLAFADAKMGSVAVKTGTVTGSVVDLSGKALSDVAIVVSDTAGNAKFSATTDEDGKYTLSDLVAGQYSMRIGDNMGIQLTVLDTASASTLKIILPPEYSAGLAWPVTKLGWGLTAGGGAAVVGGTAAVVNNNGGSGSGGPVSI